MHTYTAIFHREPDGGYLVEVPALRSCFTQGDNYEEACENARDVIQLVLEDMLEHGEEIPEDVTVERMTVPKPTSA